MNNKYLLTVIITVITGGTATSVTADPLSFGVRANVFAADGEPANDMLGYGVHGKYDLSSTWRLGFGLDFSDFDFERPWKIAGIAQDPDVKEVIDANASSKLFSAWVERPFSVRGNLEWIWKAGLGFNSVDVDDVIGPAADGGSFDITTDVGSEFVVLAGTGLQWQFANSWNIDAMLNIQQRFADWKVTDRVSGKSGSLNDYTVWGLQLGVVYDF